MIFVGREPSDTDSITFSESAGQWGMRCPSQPDVPAESPHSRNPYPYTISTQDMAEAESPPEKTTVNIRMTETFLEDVDGTWEEYGFNSRSEFVRAVLRDALKHPEFNRADLKAMLSSEAEIREGRTHRSDEVKADYGLGESVPDSDE